MCSGQAIFRASIAVGGANAVCKQNTLDKAGKKQKQHYSSTRQPVIGEWLVVNMTVCVCEGGGGGGGGEGGMGPYYRLLLASSLTLMAWVATRDMAFASFWR